MCSSDLGIRTNRRLNRDPKFRSNRMVGGGARRDRTDDILLAKQALSQLSYGPIPCLTEPVLVGPGRLELPTSRLSGVRSNHLSYGPPGIRLDWTLSTVFYVRQLQHRDELAIGVNSRLAGTLNMHWAYPLATGQRNKKPNTLRVL